MDALAAQLNIMLEGLKKKELALVEVLSISENQRTVIESELPIDNARELVFEMNQGKQDAIQIVKDCDNMFEAMLKDMGQELDAKQDLYKPQVKIMQDYIRRIMDLDVKIRVTEGENIRLMDERRGIELSTQPPVTAPVQTPDMQQSGLKPKVTMPTDSAKVINAYRQGSENYKG